MSTGCQKLFSKCSKWVIAAALVAVLMASSAATASAAWGDCYLPYGNPYGYGYGYGYQYGVGPSYVPTPPYFAIHPPVYYSHVINRRSYGSSPFAYPGTYSESAPAVAAAVAPPAEPLWITNPYFKGKTEAAVEAPADEAPAAEPAAADPAAETSGIIRNMPVAAIRNPFVR